MRSKYGSVATTVDGVKFSSKREGRRYGELLMLQRAGEIRELELQPWYQILPGGNCEWLVNGVVTPHKISRRRYTADFYYYDTHIKRWVIEEVKGMKTTDYKLRRDIFLTMILPRLPDKPVFFENG